MYLCNISLFVDTCMIHFRCLNEVIYSILVEVGNPGVKVEGGLWGADEEGLETWILNVGETRLKLEKFCNIT